MTNSSDERISALMDGELDEQMQGSTIDELLNEDRVRSTWARYHLISDTLRQNLPTGLDKQFSSRVMSALDDEPTVLAPRPAQISSMARRLAGLAVAASVAAVAVMGVQFMYQEDGLATNEQIAKAPGTLPPNALPSKSLSTNQALARAEVRQNIQAATQSMGSTAINQAAMTQQFSQQQPLQPNLNKYLIDHNQQTARAAVQGVSPYARIVAHPSARYIIIPAQK